MQIRTQDHIAEHEFGDVCILIRYEFAGQDDIPRGRWLGYAFAYLILPKLPAGKNWKFPIRIPIAKIAQHNTK